MFDETGFRKQEACSWHSSNCARPHVTVAPVVDVDFIVHVEELPYNREALAWLCDRRPPRQRGAAMQTPRHQQVHCPRMGRDDG